MRRCFALLYTRISFLPLPLPSFPSLLPLSRPAGVRECPECLEVRERAGRGVSRIRSGHLSPGLSTETETRFGPSAREESALWLALYSILFRGRYPLDSWNDEEYRIYF